VAAINWTRCRLSRVKLDFLRGFGRSRESMLAKSTAQLFHGSPRSHMEDILASSRPRHLIAMLAGTSAAVSSRRTPSRYRIGVIANQSAGTRDDQSLRSDLPPGRVPRAAAVKETRPG
jgi:hypothetical protein